MDPLHEASTSNVSLGSDEVDTRAADRLVHGVLKKPILQMELTASSPQRSARSVSEAQGAATCTESVGSWGSLEHLYANAVASMTVHKLLTSDAVRDPDSPPVLTPLPRGPDSPPALTPLPESDFGDREVADEDIIRREIFESDSGISMALMTQSKETGKSRLALVTNSNVKSAEEVLSWIGVEGPPAEWRVARVAPGSAVDSDSWHSGSDLAEMSGLQSRPVTASSERRLAAMSSVPAEFRPESGSSINSRPADSFFGKRVAPGSEVELSSRMSKSSSSYKARPESAVENKQLAAMFNVHSETRPASALESVYTEASLEEQILLEISEDLGADPSPGILAMPSDPASPAPESVHGESEDSLPDSDIEPDCATVSDYEDAGFLQAKLAKFAEFVPSPTDSQVAESEEEYAEFLQAELASFAEFEPSRTDSVHTVSDESMRASSAAVSNVAGSLVGRVVLSRTPSQRSIEGTTDVGSDGLDDSRSHSAVQIAGVGARLKIDDDESYAIDYSPPPSAPLSVFTEASLEQRIVDSLSLMSSAPPSAPQSVFTEASLEERIVNIFSLMSSAASTPVSAVPQSVFTDASLEQHIVDTLSLLSTENSTPVSNVRSVFTEASLEERIVNAFNLLEPDTARSSYASSQAFTDASSDGQLVHKINFFEFETSKPSEEMSEIGVASQDSSKKSKSDAESGMHPQDLDDLLVMTGSPITSETKESSHHTEEEAAKKAAEERAAAEAAAKKAAEEKAAAEAAARMVVDDIVAAAAAELARKKAAEEAAAATSARRAANAKAAADACARRAVEEIVAAASAELARKRAAEKAAADAKLREEEAARRAAAEAADRKAAAEAVARKAAAEVAARLAALEASETPKREHPEPLSNTPSPVRKRPTKLPPRDVSPPQPSLDTVTPRKQTPRKRRSQPPQAHASWSWSAPQLPGLGDFAPIEAKRSVRLAYHRVISPPPIYRDSTSALVEKMEEAAHRPHFHPLKQNSRWQQQRATYRSQPVGRLRKRTRAASRVLSPVPETGEELPPVVSVPGRSRPSSAAELRGVHARTAQREEGPPTGKTSRPRSSSTPSLPPCGKVASGTSRQASPRGRSTFYTSVPPRLRKAEPSPDGIEWLRMLHKGSLPQMICCPK